MWNGSFRYGGKVMNKRRLLAVIGLALLLNSCGRPAATPTPTKLAPEPTATREPEPTQEPTPAPTATVEPTPTEEPPREPAANFEEAPCPFALSQDVPIQCGFVVVPEDHNDPAGPKIRLSIAVLRDEVAGHQPDAVMLLSGGPGEKTVHNAAAVAELLGPVHPHRDLIIFDQRGVGLSEPALECPEFVQAAFDLLDEPDPDITIKALFDATLACRDRLASAGHNLSVYNTVQNAADVDAIRLALGYDKVNLWGGSYGSLLAQAVMRDHPEGIRSVAINSILPLEKSVFVDASTTTSNAIVKLLDACAADEACANAFPDLRDVLFEVVDRLNEEPAPITVTNPLDGQRYASVLTGDEVIGNLVTFLYFTEIIPVLPQAVHDLQDQDYTLMTQLSGTRLALFDALSRGMMYSVMCSQDLIGKTPEDLLNNLATLPRQLVGSVDPEFSIEHGIFGICENWPVTEADPWVKEPLISDIPTLVLTGEFDPVTPPEYGELVAGYLSNSYYFELPGIGHDILVASPCARDLIGAFIADPTQPPDASCVAEMPGIAFDVPGDTAEVTLEPYTNEELGIRALVPAGWDEVQAATFARGSPAVDMAVVQLAVVPLGADELPGLLAENYGLAEIPESTGEREANGFAWSLYEFEAQGVPRDVAVAAHDQASLVVIMRSAADERDALRASVFFPVVDALTVSD
jgi:pimeloyl-ACP methyl ester carboxylesterase